MCCKQTEEELLETAELFLRKFQTEEFSHLVFVSREFRFTSEVPIWLDYHGKHVVIEQVRGDSPSVIEADLRCNKISHLDCVLYFTGNICRNSDRAGPVKLLWVKAEEALLSTRVKIHSTISVPG